MEISGGAKVLGVIGHPIGHSLSPAMHNAAIRALGLDCVYVPFDVPPDDLPKAIAGIRALGIAGVNITVPHKEAVIGLLDEVDSDAQAVGSVNTIVNDGGRLIGYSTDGAGFERSLTESGFSLEGCLAVVLGAGGAGRAVVFALARAGARVVLFDAASGKAERLAKDVGVRRGQVLSVQESELRAALDRANLLVNCTPIGMYPNQDGIPIPEELLKPEMLVYDLVYNPVKTRLLAAAEAIGAHTVSGAKMLVYQGALSLKLWTGAEPPVGIMEAAVLDRL